MNSKLKIVIIVIALFSQACEDYDDITYYNVVGEGYVFAYDSVGVLHPIEGAKIQVGTSLENNPGGIFGNSPEFGNYTTGKTGKYTIKFIKRTKHENAINYRIYVDYLHYTKDFRIDVSEVKSAKKILKLDTIKFYK